VSDGRTMTQAAPYPAALEHLVERLAYRPGWQFVLTHMDRGQGSEGLTLDIVTLGYDSYHPERGESYRVHHYMPVPPAAYGPGSWQRWLFEQCLLVERHEAMEFFTVHDSPGSEHAVKPYAPNHDHGEDPYIVHDPTTGEARRTSFRNVLDDDGTGRARVNAPVISAGLAAELDRYRGRWVAIIDQHVVSDGDSPEEAAAGQPGFDPLIFRVPERSLAAFLGIGQHRQES
jgi:hypothetical protein